MDWLFTDENVAIAIVIAGFGSFSLHRACPHDGPAGGESLFNGNHSTADDDAVNAWHQALHRGSHRFFNRFTDGGRG